MTRLYIIGSIDDEAYEKFSKELRELEIKKVKACELEIVSEGGDAETGLAFYGRIKSSSVKITAIGHGLVQSAAMLVFAACSTRLCTKECIFFVHNSEHKIAGDYKKLYKAYTNALAEERAWAGFLDENSTTPAGQWRIWSDEDTYLNAEQILATGLVQKIIGD